MACRSVEERSLIGAKNGPVKVVVDERVDVPCRIDPEPIDANLLDHPAGIPHQIGVGIFRNRHTT